jgi:hypothetical protein
MEASVCWAPTLFRYLHAPILAQQLDPPGKDPIFQSDANQITVEIDSLGEKQPHKPATAKAIRRLVEDALATISKNQTLVLIRWSVGQTGPYTMHGSPGSNPKSRTSAPRRPPIIFKPRSVSYRPQLVVARHFIDRQNSVDIAQPNAHVTCGAQNCRPLALRLTITSLGASPTGWA